MDKRYIQNFSDLATTKNRAEALSIALAGLAAISPEAAVFRSIKLEGDELSIQEEKYDLKSFRRIKVVGFGKAAAAAADALEKILGRRITAGAVVGLEQKSLEHIRVFAGTHPKSSAANVLAGKEIERLVAGSLDSDLVIALISGGGSALLCASDRECEQGNRLYEAFLSTGKGISELNTVRKHLSGLKGGGLARLAYPATVIGLVFSDVPGDKFADVASGPTYPDQSTVADAQKIINENNLGSYDLVETTKDGKYFEKVRNFILVSNKIAAEAMASKAEELGYRAVVHSTELYAEVSVAAREMIRAAGEGTAVIAAGEPKITVGERTGRGGRNTHLALSALAAGLPEGSVFISLASDGLDNGPFAGAIADKLTAEKAATLGLQSEKYLAAFDSGSFFETTGDTIMTGPTGTNVSDLMILITKK